MVALRPLSPDHCDELAEFRCRSYGKPWTDVIEEMVTEHLCEALPYVDALGLWEDGRLVGVAAWTVSDPVRRIARVALVAVRIGAQRRGYGRRLKLRVIERARQAECVELHSSVHIANGAMLELNKELGARVGPIAGDPDHLRCELDLGVSYG